MPHKNVRIAAWDLETSNLNANGGFILCAGIIDPYTKKTKMFRVDKYPGWRRKSWDADLGLVTDLVEYLNEFDAWVTYYGAKFDLPFLNTRVLYWRAKGADVPLPANVPHIDLYRTAKHRLKLHSNRLQVVNELLATGDKTKLDLPLWLRAAGGDRAALGEVVHHCAVDCETLAKDYILLRPLIPAHPNLGLLLGRGLSCSNCGSSDVQRRGTYVTPATTRQRLACKACGRWSSVPFKQDIDAASVKAKKKRPALA